MLCDLMMPEMSGIELFERLTQENPVLAEKVIFLTGGAFTEKSRTFLDAPGRRLLEKPFDPQQLTDAVRGVVGT